MQLRKNALDAYIEEGLSDYEELEIIRHEDETITGVPLFASRSPYSKMGKLFGSDVSTEVFLPLVFDYKLNSNKESLNKLMTLFDYYHDQGWAEGSGLGTPDHQTNRSSGYFVAVYLMREELKEARRFEREIGAMNWYTDFGKVYGRYKTDYAETRDDEMRTHFLYRLLYVMAMEDSPEKVRALNSYIEWADSALEQNPIFNEKEAVRHGLLLSADTPVMAMIGEDGKNQILFSISDPDLRLPKLPNQSMDEKTATTNSVGKTVTVTLKGNWAMPKGQDGIRLVKAENGRTVMEFDCIDGMTKVVLLQIIN